MRGVPAPRLERIRALLLGAALSFVASSVVTAQTPDTTKRAVPADSAKAATARAPRVPRAPALITRLAPPITPKRAFLYSLALPGFGQSRLDRGVSGALFSGVELSAITMLRRSSADLREARRYLSDSLPITFNANGTTATPVGRSPNAYTADLIRTRRLHVEDWLAVLAFNHLLSGADAFVSAQLWDVPVKLAALPRPDGAVLVATIRW